MGSDRASILTHENGKKHKANLEESLKRKRQDKAREEKQQAALEKHMAMIEREATQAHWTDLSSGSFQSQSGGVGGGVGNRYGAEPMNMVSALGGDPTAVIGNRRSCVPVSVSSQGQPVEKNESCKGRGREKDGSEKKAELNSWKNKKERRKNDDNDENANDTTERSNFSTDGKVGLKKISNDEGHYEIDGVTYLEGKSTRLCTQQTERICLYLLLEGEIFGNIIREGTAVELWIGSSEKRGVKMLSENIPLWKAGLVLKVYKDAKDIEKLSFDVAYLRDPSDKEETVESKAVCSRLRLALGRGDGVPSSLEEARLIRQGGESIEQFKMEIEIDDKTGFSTWNTVSVRKATVQHEESKERAREWAKRREEAQKEEDTRKEAEVRRMEEAKNANADDSALGAYDVWNSGSGYKGVDISKEMKLNSSDTAKSLADGAKVAFKKRISSNGNSSNNVKKKKFRRKTQDVD